MPLDVRGRTRATMADPTGIRSRKGLVNQGKSAVLGIEYCNYALERGIPSKHESTAHADCVPALCTHRPSLPRTELFRE
jgi:hypothetical protein